MAFINKGKHIEKEINETRVRVVEDNATTERVEFLQKLLEHNGYTVLTEENVPKPPPPPKPLAEGEEAAPPAPQEPLIPTWTIGVTQITFNPVLMVYNRALKTFDGKKVTPDYWNQVSEKAEPNYWDLGKKG